LVVLNVTQRLRNPAVVKYRVYHLMRDATVIIVALLTILRGAAGYFHSQVIHILLHRLAVLQTPCNQKVTRKKYFYPHFVFIQDSVYS
jgi:hypothetical protein